MLVFMLDAVIHFFRERRKQDKRRIGIELFQFSRKSEGIHHSGVVHRNDKVELLTTPNHFQGFHFRFSTHNSRRITQIKIRIFLRNLHVQTAIFLQQKIVVVIANEKDALYSPRHQ